MNDIKSALCIALLLLISACSHDKESVETPKVSYHKQASDLRRDGAPADEYIAMQQKAVQELREGRSKENPVSVLSQMGYFYMRTSDYVKAAEYLQEAADISAANKEKDGHGDAFLFGNLATLYHRFGLYDKAMEANMKAIEIARETRPTLLCDLYRMRATLSKDMPADSTFYYFQKAINVTGEIEEDQDYKSKLIHSVVLDRACHIIEKHERYPDSIDRQIEVVENLIKNNRTKEYITTEKFILGYGYWLKGQKDRGIALMEKAMMEYKEQKWTESVYWGSEILMKIYAQDKNYERMAQLYPRYKEMADSVAGAEKLNAAIAADIRYRASTKERENQMLDLELTVARQKFIIMSVLTLLAVAAVAASIIYAVRRNRLHRRKRLELTRYIEELQNSHQELNSRIETLVDEINTEKVENAASQLSPSLLKSDEEGKFRRLFETLYPNFIPSLKEKSSKLTANDEVLCMLIYMRQTNEEIAKCLGITRMSVNTARYRIRTRLGLTKETDLDEFICAIRGG